MLLSDYEKQAGIEPAQPTIRPKKADECLCVFMQALATLAGKENAHVEPRLVQNVWPPSVTCVLADCVASALASGYISEHERTVSITAAGLAFVRNECVA